MKYQIKNGFICKLDNDGEFETDQDLGYLFTENNLPKFKVENGVAVKVSKEFELSSQEFFDQVMKTRESRYRLESDKLFLEYCYMKENEDESEETREAKKSQWIETVNKIKTELPKPEVKNRFFV